MAGQLRGLNKLILFVIVTLFAYGTAARAQEPPPPLLRITRTDASSPPVMELQVFGLTSQGAPLDLTAEPLRLTHNGLPVLNYSVARQQEVGTFTLFLIDIPGGVSQQTAAIADAITQFASPGSMQEQLDAVAVFQIGEQNAIQLLEPTQFYNSVRNLFAEPLTPASGATALVDSSMGLLAQVETLKPDPRMATSMVIISDGTDAVSTQFQPEEVAPRAAELGIPIHTIWLANEDLSSGAQQAGQDYLISIASGSRGLAIQLQNVGDLPIIWNRIASLRLQPIVQYTVADLTGGLFPVELSLANQPEVSATGEIVVPTNTPSIQINLPAESRVLTLPDLDNPVRLQFSTTLAWLDGFDRQLAAATLIVNGSSQDVPVESIASFTAELSNLGFGDNSIQIVVLDDQGLRATSPTLTLTVNQGSREIPAELAPGGSTVGRLIVGVLVLLILAGGVLFMWRQGWLKALPVRLPRGRRVRPGPSVTIETPEEDEPRVLAWLQVLESVTTMPMEIGLTQVRIRIGRSPAQSELAFENDLTVSRLHATLTLEGTRYRIFDEGSTSGTWVNERQVPEYGTQLADGDEIHLGAVHLRYRQP